MSNCGCIYVDDCDFGCCTVLFQKEVKARKEHKCTNCGREISKHEYYETIKSVEDGKIYTYKTCQDCLSIRNEFFCGAYYFEFMEALDEHLFAINGEVSSECLNNLTPKARDMIIKKIDYIWERDND